MDTACESLHNSCIKYRWLNVGETLSRTLGNSCLSSVSSHRFTLPCIRLIVSVITTEGYELNLCYERGEQLDKLCFSASHLFRYWKTQNYVHTQCVCILCIFCEIKHLTWLDIIWTNAGILLIRPWGTNCNEIFTTTQQFLSRNAFKNVVWKMEAIFISASMC